LFDKNGVAPSELANLTGLTRGAISKLADRMMAKGVVMNAEFGCVAERCTADSDASRMSFPQVVGKLMDAGVERYHADLICSEKTYFLPTGESRVIPNEDIRRAPAAEFAAPSVEAAVKAIQKGEIDYRTFCERVLDAGCVGYHIYIAGRRVIYYGRTGDSHTEYFSGGK